MHLYIRPEFKNGSNTIFVITKKAISCRKEMLPKLSRASECNSHQSTGHTEERQALLNQTKH